MRAAVFSFSVRGAELSKKISEQLERVGYSVENKTVRKYSEQTKISPMDDYNAACAEAFKNCEALVFVGAVGIAVRTIAPFIKSKTTDPAVLSVDERGNFMIPLLSGHIGGANELTRYLAASLGALPCVTTATDVNGLFAVDEWAARNRMLISSMSDAKAFAAALVHGERVGAYIDEKFFVEGELPRSIEGVKEIFSEKLSVGLAVTLQKNLQPFATTVRLLPRIVHLGIGCRRGTPLENIEALVLPTLEECEIDLRSVVGIASVDLKKDEQGLLAFAEKNKIPARFYTAQELENVEGDFSTSSFVQSIVGVSNVCERSAVLDSGGGRLILRKKSLNGVTLAVAIENLSLNFNSCGLKTE